MLGQRRQTFQPATQVQMWQRNSTHRCFCSDGGMLSHRRCMLCTCCHAHSAKFGHVRPPTTFSRTTHGRPCLSKRREPPRLEAVRSGSLHQQPLGFHRSHMPSSDRPLCCGHQATPTKRSTASHSRGASCLHAASTAQAAPRSSVTIIWSAWRVRQHQGSHIVTAVCSSSTAAAASMLPTAFRTAGTAGSGGLLSGMSRLRRARAPFAAEPPRVLKYIFLQPAKDLKMLKSAPCTLP